MWFVWKLNVSSIADDMIYIYINVECFECKIGPTGLNVVDLCR